MKAFVINLAAARDRMDFQAGQLARYAIDHERLEAVDRTNVSPPPNDPYWSGWERPLRVTEMAALCSHRAAWRRIAEADAPALVLEDDAILLPGIGEFLRRAEPLTDIDHISLETHGRRKLVSRRWHPRVPMRRLYQDRTGAAAYILWPAGARKLLRRIERRPALADAAICAAYDLSSWQADPALAIQADLCADHGMAPPFDPTSVIDRVDRPELRDLPLARRVTYTGRRLASQFRMGLRGARFRLSGRLRMIDAAVDRRAT